MKHLFSEHVKTNELWLVICQWIQNKIGLYIPITKEEKILGYTNQDQNCIPFNYIHIGIVLLC